MSHAMVRRGFGPYIPSPIDVGKEAAQLLFGGGGGAAPTPAPTPAPPPASLDQVPPPPSATMSDTTKYVLIGAGVIGAGIIIYAVATAKRRRR